jgi:LPS-assembly lipoprotein
MTASRMLLTRRQVLHGAAALGTALALTGCGFRLRGAPQMPFQRLQIVGFRPGSPLAEELRLQLEGSTTTRIVESAGEAEAVLEVLSDARTRSGTASTSAGQVRDIQLSATLRFLLRTPDGRNLIGPDTIGQSRDMTYNERDALAKESEEEMLYRAMSADIASQVLRRLASVRMPAN